MIKAEITGWGTFYATDDDQFNSDMCSFIHTYLSPFQGVPSRRQLHSQHRALSRALMDPELQSLRRKGPATIARLQERAKLLDNNTSGGATAAAGGNHNGDHIRVRLAELVTIFGEVDRAAKRLEHLTEQRRECLREMTRQRALEDEINDVSISNSVKKDWVFWHVS